MTISESEQGKAAKAMQAREVNLLPISLVTRCVPASGLRGKPFS
jgi:hypothetical protein